MRVERIGGAWKINGVYYDPESVVQIAAERDTLRTRLAEVEAENGRLREALEPFARLAHLFPKSEDDLAATTVTAGELRRARAALAQTKEPSHDDDT